MSTGELVGRLTALVVCVGCAALGLVIWAEPTTPRHEHLKIEGLTLVGVAVSFMIILALDTLRQIRRRPPRDRGDL
jgi:hypothetical protein